MAIKSNAGTIVSVSAVVPATFDAAGYAALTYTEIGYLENAVEGGREYNITTFNPIKTRSTMKFKTTYDEGDTTLTIAYDPSDAGMVILKAALLSDNDYSFKVVDGGTADVTRYFSAKVSSLRRSSGDAAAIRMVDVMLAISSVGTSGVGIIEVVV